MADSIDVQIANAPTDADAEAKADAYEKKAGTARAPDTYSTSTPTALSTSPDQPTGRSPSMIRQDTGAPTPANSQAVMANINNTPMGQAILRNQQLVQASLDRQNKELAPTQQKYDQAVEETEKKLAQHAAQIEQMGVDDANQLQPWNADKETAKYTTPTMEKFGSVGMVFAMVASAFTHQPMVNALNAGAAAMNAITENDNEKYKRAYDAWKANTELVVQRNTLMMNAYRESDALLEKRPDLYNQQMTEKINRFGDEQRNRLLLNGDYIGLQNLNISQTQMGLQLEEHMKAMIPINNYQAWLQTPEGRAAGPIERNAIFQQMQSSATAGTMAMSVPLDASLQGLSGQAFLDKVPKQTATMVKALDEGRMQFPIGRAATSPFWQNMIAMVAAYDPNFDAQNYGVRYRTRIDFSTGKSGQNRVSLNTAVGHLWNVWNDIDTLNNSGIPWWNEKSNEYNQALGNSRFQAAIKQFHTDRDAVATELMRVFRGTGASTQEVQAWEQQFSDADSPVGLKSTVNAAIGLMVSRMEALQDQYDSNMGSSHPAYYMLTAHSVHILSEISRQINGDPDLQAAGVRNRALEAGIMPGDPTQYGPGADLYHRNTGAALANDDAPVAPPTPASDAIRPNQIIYQDNKWVKIDENGMAQPTNPPPGWKPPAGAKK